jgi:hypothetical protein
MSMKGAMPLLTMYRKVTHVKKHIVRRDSSGQNFITPRGSRDDDQGERHGRKERSGIYQTFVCIHVFGVATGPGNGRAVLSFTVMTWESRDSLTGDGDGS